MVFNRGLALSNNFFFLYVIVSLYSVLYKLPPLTDRFCGTTRLYLKRTHFLCRSLSHSTLKVPQSTPAQFMDGLRYLFICACTSHNKFNMKPQVNLKAFLNICGSLSYLCPQTICLVRYPKAVMVLKKLASTETQYFSKQSGRLTNYILSASIL